MFFAILFWHNFSFLLDTFAPGFRWLLSEISSDYADLSRRVEKDIAEQVLYQ